MGYWVGISNKRNWWSTAETTMSESVPFLLNMYMPRTRFEVIILSLCYANRNYVEYNDRFFDMLQME